MNEQQDKQPVNYLELTLTQVETVEKVADDYKALPNDDTDLQLEIELEKLCFYQNSAKGKPKVRAFQTAERVRSIVLGRAITQRAGRK